MSLEWTDIGAVERDLAEAQGFVMSAALIDTLRIDERPPVVSNEIEVEDIGHGGDTTQTPDFTLIKEMVKRVRYEIAGEQPKIPTPPLVDVQSTPKKRRANVAMESILENYKNMQKPNTNENLSNIPNGIMPDHKSRDWDPTTMFKRKSTCRSTVSVMSSDSVKSSPAGPKVWTPSTPLCLSSVAEKYPSIFAERRVTKKDMATDIWSHVEKALKCVDDKKRAEQLASDLATETLVEYNNNSEAVIGPDVIQLPHHRHLLTGDCAVCIVLKGRGFDIDAWL